MNTRSAAVSLLCAVAASTAPGCALLSKGDQGAARFFSLERASGRSGAGQAQAPATRADLAALRLGHVTGAPHLEQRLVFRDSAYEIGYYRELRWTEPPERYLERLLARVLFEERGLRHVVGGAGQTLEVQLTAFDEIRGPQRLARAQIIARLHDEHLVLFEETMTVDRVVGESGGDRGVATVKALGEAMQAAVGRIADRVVRELEERR